MRLIGTIVAHAGFALVGCSAIYVARMRSYMDSIHLRWAFEQSAAPPRLAFLQIAADEPSIEPRIMCR